MDSLREERGPVRSMSAKGCGPDNAAAEGFLGGPGSGFLYGRDWKGIGYEEFCRRLAACLTHCNETGVKKSLGWMSPRYSAAEARTGRIAIQKTSAPPYLGCFSMSKPGHQARFHYVDALGGVRRREPRRSERVWPPMPYSVKTSA